MTIIKLLISTFSLLAFIPLLNAQDSQSYSSAEILHDIQKLKTTARVLYIAAHPDDENTRLISYLENDRNIETAYLSLTRGDGGQNVIGSELREGLGLIRTQELLAARDIDGGQQFFTRANDFGYSKNPNETFQVWDREKVLSDVVWVIRNFQPDIIITRFNKTPGITHGHHTASAILAHEAFSYAANENKYKDQLEFVKPWQTKKIFWNTSSWFYRGNDNFDPSKYLQIEVGGYNAILGQSYTEIAALSRSQHKSQAFGTSGTRGSEIELFEQWEGPQSSLDFFDGMNTGWGKSKNAQMIDNLVNDLIRDYDASKPAKSLGSILTIREWIKKLPDSANKRDKIQLLDHLILKITGFYHMLSTSTNFGSPSDSLQIDLELVNRAENVVSIDKLIGIGFDLEKSNVVSLGQNESFNLNKTILLDDQLSYSTPYWLRNTNGIGMYQVNDQQLIGNPENEASVALRIEMTVGSQKLTIRSPLLYRSNDRIKGEVIEPFYVSPPVSIDFENEVYIFTQANQQKAITVNIKALANNITGSFKLILPKGWKQRTDGNYNFESLQKGEVRSIIIDIISGDDFGSFNLMGEVSLGDNLIKESVTEINYDHIPSQVIISEANARLMFADVKTSERMVGYIDGAGDYIPQALEAMGYSVKNIDIATISQEDLNKIPVIVAGIRAYNTNAELQNQYNKLFEYMSAGGTYIVQYNTTYSLPNKDFFPFDLTLSRDRITDETAELKILVPDQTLFNLPNKITTRDFDDWVQERGLYFPSAWSNEYEGLLEGNDPNEGATRGALLVANYGKGKFVYTGLSFFRELPAGVPGAFRLFSNIVSY